VISTDFVSPLPPSRGFDSIQVYSDHYTKGAHFVATRTTADAMTVIDHHIKHIFPLHGAPEKFVSDCGPQFAARMTQEFYKHLGIEQALTTAYHPQANGQTERTNQDLVRYLCMFANTNQDNWADLLPMAEFAYNSHVHSATGKSLFKLLYGYQLQWETPVGGSSVAPAIDQRMDQLWKARADAEAALCMSKEAMASSSADYHCDRPVFKVGDWVWLNTIDLRIKQPSPKLGDKRRSPYQVMEVVNSNSYRLDCDDLGIHNVLSVDRLLCWGGNEVNGTTPIPPPPVVIEGEEEYVVKSIRDSRIHEGQLEYLV
jgi:hypothetical protein